MSHQSDCILFLPIYCDGGLGLFPLQLFKKPVVLMFFFFSLEKGDLRIKTEALKRVIQQILNGEKMPSLLMVIIKFLMPLDDHTIKKLLLIFWEIVPKTGQDGKLLQEMILVCDAYRKVRVFITGRYYNCAFKIYSKCFLALQSQCSAHSKAVLGDSLITGIIALSLSVVT